MSNGARSQKSGIVSLTGQQKGGAAKKGNSLGKVSLSTQQIIIPSTGNADLSDPNVPKDAAMVDGAGLDALRTDPGQPGELFCFCKQPENMDMIACDICEQWFHAICFGINLVS